MWPIQINVKVIACVVSFSQRKLTCDQASLTFLPRRVPSRRDKKYKRRLIAGSAEIEQASEKAGERRSTPGVSKELKRSGERVSCLFFALPPSFVPSRKLLETPTTQSIKFIVHLACI